MVNGRPLPSAKWLWYQHMRLSLFLMTKRSIEFKAGIPIGVKEVIMKKSIKKSDEGRKSLRREMDWRNNP
ncbi:hypothetical protein CHM34_02690 [Paludifilum halophilum]|uniref:Uncharacterized protein n=1 Tax=Paludifilum halophilum TaxID=1642702 RepID=A0A235BCW6_9BACL|nr:hypothetical protein CHM34_02690 [Paludifilum halophilum]